MTKDKMLDYIVAQLPPELTPSGLIFVAAEFLFRSRLQYTLNPP